MTDSRLPTIVANAEQVIARFLGSPIRIGDPEVLRDFGYPRVLRCPVLESPADIGPSVILKRFGISGNGHYDIANAQKPWGGLFSEWAGATFLEDLGLQPSLGPRCFGGDTNTGLVVLEDLGPGQSLADSLQSGNPHAAENAFTQYAASLGRLHAATIGHQVHLEAIWSQCGHPWQIDQTPYRQAESWPHENAAPFREACSALGVPIATGFDKEANGVWQEMANPGPFLAFTPGDPCPDNHRLISNHYCRFFDFEASGYRHALLDAAYCLLPFPTCWCVLRLPSTAAPLAIHAYRSELQHRCPAATDENRFFTALAQACASWTISYISWNLREALESNRPTGLAPQRQRLIYHLDTFIETADLLSRLPALRDTTAALAAYLRCLWPEESEIPFFPMK